MKEITDFDIKNPISGRKCHKVGVNVKNGGGLSPSQRVTDILTFPTFLSKSYPHFSPF